jgi:hypothetical protein
MTDMDAILKSAEVSTGHQKQVIPQSLEITTQVTKADTLDLVKAVNELSDDETPLETLVRLKKIAKAIAAAETTLTEAANRQYQAAGTKTMAVLGATVKAYTKPAKWKFSDNITKVKERLKQQKAQLDGLMAAEKKSGVAIKTPVTLNIAKDRLFAISL